MINVLDMVPSDTVLVESFYNHSNVSKVIKHDYNTSSWTNVRGCHWFLFGKFMITSSILVFDRS